MSKYKRQKRNREIARQVLQAQREQRAQQEKLAAKSQKASRGSSSLRRVRTAAISLVAVLLAFSLFGSMVYAWFFQTIEADGAQITTGHIGITLRSYKTDGSNGLVRYLDLNADSPDSVEMVSGLQREVGQFAFAGAADDVYFVIERDAGSVGLDTYLSFTLEGVDGSGTLSDYVGGYYFQLENVSTQVKNATESGLSDVAVFGGAAGAATPTEKKLYTYMTQAGANGATRTPLSFITMDCGTNTATDLRTGSLCVYRLTTLLDEACAQSVYYQNQGFRVRISLNVGQTGSLTGGTGNTYLISSAEDLRLAMASCSPGDQIGLNTDLTFNGDVIFNTPVTFNLGNHTLRVNGNMILTSSYSGDYLIDTSNGGSIVLSTVGQSGGKLHIDAPHCNVTLRGDGTAEPDITVTKEMTVNCANAPYPQYMGAATEQTGFRLDQCRVADANARLKSYTVYDNTRVCILPETESGVIVARDDAECISVINRGTVENIQLNKMRLYNDASSYWSAGVPQIYIDNYGSIAQEMPIPTNATPFPDNYGNTYIMREFRASDTNGVVDVPGYHDSDIHGIDTNVIDVDGDGTNLLVYYSDLSHVGGTDLTLHRIFFEGYGGFAGYFAGGLHSIEAVRRLRIVTDGTTELQAADYEDLNRFSGLQELDLSESDCNTLGGAQMPDRPFRDLSALKKLALPGNLTKLPIGTVTGTSVADLYLPAGVVQVTEDAMAGVKYVHPQANTVVNGLNAGDADRYIFVPGTGEATLERYRNLYQAKRVFREAILAEDGNYFYRPDANTAEFAVWVGSVADALALSQLDTVSPATGEQYYVVSFDDYAFAEKMTGAAGKYLTLGSQLRTIGQNAFADCTALKRVEIKSSKLRTIGEQAFAGCNGLTEVEIDGMQSQGGERPVFLGADDVSKSPFCGCTGLETVTLRHIGRVEANLFRPDGANVLPIRYLTVEEADAIAQDAFLNAPNLMTVECRNVTVIEAHAFKGSAVEYVYLPGTETVKDEAFRDCTRLKLAGAPDAAVIGISLFQNDTALEGVSLPAITTVENLSANMKPLTLAGCEALRVAETAIPYQNENGITGGLNFSLFAKESGNTTCPDLALWVIRDETYTRASLPSYFLTGIAAPKTVVLANTQYSKVKQGLSLTLGGDITMQLTADLQWADSEGTGADRVSAGDGSHTRYLCDIGLGDYAYQKSGTLTTLLRCVLHRVTGVENVPALSDGAGTVEVGTYAFRALPCRTPQAADAEKPTVVLPADVTSVAAKGFYACGLTGVQGDSVRFLGISAFENSSQLRFAKFCNLVELEGTLAAKVGSVNNSCLTKTFMNCPKFEVLETGIIDAYYCNVAKYRANISTSNIHSATWSSTNFLATLYGCTDFKYWIIHTETAAHHDDTNTYPSFYRALIAGAFRNPQNGNAEITPVYYLILSETSSVGLNYLYNNPIPWNGTDPKRISTHQLMADAYCYANDINEDRCFVRTELVDSWHLSDIGYGDYICEDLGNQTAGLTTPLLLGQSITAANNGHIYETPNETVSGLPITEIGDYAFAQVVFGTAQSPVPIRLADNTVTVGSGAFLGQYCSCPSYGSTPDVKHFKNIDLNRVQTVKALGFGGYEPQLEKVTAYALQTLESNSLVCIYSGSNPVPFTTIELYTPNRVQANGAFGASSQSTPAVPPANLRVKVYAAVYNDTVNGYSADDFGYFYGDEKYWDAGYKILLALEGDKAHFELLEE